MKKLPFSLEAEEYLISCMMNENETIGFLKELIKPEHFYLEQNRLLCSTIYKMNDNKTPVDLVTLFEALKDNVDASVIAKINTVASSTSNIKYYRAIVYDKFLRRNLIKSIAEINDNIYNETIDLGELIETTTLKIKSAYEGFPIGELNLYERLEDILKNLSERRTKDEESLQSKVFPSLTKLTNGLRHGNMISLSGKDKQGKSTFAQKLTLDFAINSKIPVGIFSFEMSQEVLDWKSISFETFIDYNKLRNPRGYYLDPSSKLTDKEFEKISLVSGRRFHGTKIYTCDKILNELQIKAKMKNWIKQYGVKFFVVDYIGLIPTSSKHETREREISYLSRFFKQTTAELDTILLILSQQNRDGDIAESLGLHRDPDFALTIEKPIDNNITSIRLDGTSYNLNENDFIVTLKRSRHGKQGKQFIVGYTTDNQFCELDKTKGDYAPIQIYPQDDNEEFDLCGK